MTAGRDYDLSLEDALSGVFMLALSTYGMLTLFSLSSTLSPTLPREPSVPKLRRKSFRSREFRKVTFEFYIKILQTRIT